MDGPAVAPPYTAPSPQTRSPDRFSAQERHPKQWQHNFQQYDREGRAMVPVLRRIEIFAPGNELVYAANMPDPPPRPSVPKARAAHPHILKITHGPPSLPPTPKPRVVHRQAPCSPRARKAHPDILTINQPSRSSTGKSSRGEDGVVLAKKRTETENEEYGNARMKADLHANNVINSGAIFGRIVPYDRTLNIPEQAFSSNVFDTRPLPLEPNPTTLQLERERKHFPHLTNKETQTRYKARGRRYIPHGYGDDYEYTPHAEHIDIKYTDCGLDWNSRLRYIPSPHNKDYPAAEIWPEQWKSVRTYPWGVSGTTRKEYKLYPDTENPTLRSTFDGVHKATAVSDKEITHSMLYGKGKMAQYTGSGPWNGFTEKYDGNHVIDKRNRIPMAAPGDKSYQVVEYSPNFYHYGSTLPIVNFGKNTRFGDHRQLAFGNTVSSPPLRENFAIKERRRRTAEEQNTVRSLDEWRPATPLEPPSKLVQDGEKKEEEKGKKAPQ